MFFRKNTVFSVCLLLFAGCNTKEKQLQEVLALQQMNELATVEYVVTKMIRANDNKTWYKIGDRKILMSCTATLTAGINLSAITREQVQIREENIELTLPRASLISVNIRPEDIKIEYEATDLLRQPFTAAERNDLAAQAEKQVKESINELGILNTAETNASLFISNFLTRLGYKKINIQFSPSIKPMLN